MAHMPTTPRSWQQRPKVSSSDSPLTLDDRTSQRGIPREILTFSKPLPNARYRIRAGNQDIGRGCPFSAVLAEEHSRCAANEPNCVPHILGPFVSFSPLHGKPAATCLHLEYLGIWYSSVSCKSCDCCVCHSCLLESFVKFATNLLTYLSGERCRSLPTLSASACGLYS